MQKTRVRLAPHERKELRKRVRTRTLRADDVRRARLILMLADGQSYTAIQQALGCNPSFITRWKERFVAERLAGLYARHRGRAVAKRTPTLEAKMARVWRRANLKPHRIERYMRSTDPAFETKAADIIGLYVNPPQHAAVFCVDEKTAIQALDRLDPVLPLSPGRAERHGVVPDRGDRQRQYSGRDGQLRGLLDLQRRARTDDEHRRSGTRATGRVARLHPG